MRENQQPHFVGLDIGTSTVRCVVGMANAADAKPSVMGHGSAPNLGMRKGVVVHVDDATEAIVQAVTEAERVSGTRIDRATVNINGPHISGINSKGVIAISAQPRNYPGVRQELQFGRPTQHQRPGRYAWCAA